MTTDLGRLKYSISQAGLNIGETQVWNPRPDKVTNQPLPGHDKGPLSGLYNRFHCRGNSSMESPDLVMLKYGITQISSNVLSQFLYQVS